MPLAEGQQIGTVRVFVGLKINQHIADLLAERARLIESAPNRFVAREDIHPTLVAPWDEVFIEGTVEKLRAALRGLKPFTLVFTHLSYWPDCHRPRLLCAECAPSDDLRSLQSALLAAFGPTKDKPFRPHITLARMQRDGRAAGRKEMLDHNLRLVQAIDSVELFQSGRDAGKGYQILASLPFLAARRTWRDLLRQGVTRIAELWDGLKYLGAQKASGGKDRTQHDRASRSGASKCCNS